MQVAQGGWQAPAGKQAVGQAGKQQTRSPPQPSAGLDHRPGAAQQHGRGERQAVDGQASQQRRNKLSLGARGKVGLKQGEHGEA